MADRYNRQVQLLDVGGRFVQTFGTYGSGSQQLNLPQDVCCLALPFSLPHLLTLASKDSPFIWSADDRQPITQIPVAWQLRTC